MKKQFRKLKKNKNDKIFDNLNETKLTTVIEKLTEIK